jgi:hypothetical protein
MPNSDAPISAMARRRLLSDSVFVRGIFRNAVVLYCTPLRRPRRSARGSGLGTQPKEGAQRNCSSPLHPWADRSRRVLDLCSCGPAKGGPGLCDHAEPPAHRALRRRHLLSRLRPLEPAGPWRGSVARPGAVKRASAVWRSCASWRTPSITQSLGRV